MKKLRYFAILFITMLIVTGCGNSDGKEILDEALKNMEKVNKATMSIELLMGNDQYSVDMKIAGDFDDETGNAYFETTASLFGMSMVTKSYTTEKEDKVYTYTSEDGETWYYTIEDASEATNSMTDLSAATKYAGDYKSVKKVKSDLEGHTKLEVTIAKDTMNKLMAETDEGAGLEITKDLVMYVYVKDGYVTKISMDLSKVIDSADMGGLTKYSMSITMSNHNKISAVTVPEDVIKNATLEDDTE